METQSNPSDDEIRSHMNFDKLVQEAKRQSGNKRMRRWWIALPLGLAIVSAGLVISNQLQGGGDDPALSTQSGSTSGGRTDSSIQSDEQKGEAHAPASPAATDAGDRNAEKGKRDGTQDRSETSSDDGLKTRSNEVNKPNDQHAVVQRNPSGAPLTTGRAADKDVYVQAEPRDGYTQLYAYFNANLQYPTEAIKDSIAGIETISFTIDKNGKAVDLSITHSLGSLFDQEAMRLIKNMPDWNPASLNGVPVASQLSVPLTFELKRIKRP